MVVSQRQPTSEPALLVQALDHTVERVPDALALVHGDRRLTWGQLGAASHRVARALLARGVGRGDQVALWLPSCIEWLTLWMGALRVGAVLVPVNTKFKAAEAAYVIRKSDARLLVMGGEFLGVDYQDRFAEICPDWADDGGRCAALPSLRDVVVLGSDARVGTTYDALLADGEEIDQVAVDQAIGKLRHDDPVAIVFTSGTTGFPKGVVHDHRALRMMTAVSDWFAYSERDRILGHFPLFHVAGLFSSFLPALINGGAFVIMDHWDPAEALRLVDTEGVTVLSGIPTHFLDLLHHPDLADHDTSSLRIGWIGGATVPAEVIRGARERLGMQALLPIYGMTELTSTTTVGRVDDPDELRLAGKGVPIGGYEVAVVDPTSAAALPAGQEGEIVVRGYTVMRGYYHDPEATAAVFDDDGWFHTGDLGVFDDDGYLQITGRLKDMYIVGGNNVHPADVENVLMGIPGIKQAVVVARDNSRLGEVGVAFLEREARGTPTEEEVLAHCRSDLASFKVPREVRFVDDWPLTPTGKVQRFRLREIATADDAPSATDTTFR